MRSQERYTSYEPLWTYLMRCNLCSTFRRALPRPYVYVKVTIVKCHANKYIIHLNGYGYAGGYREETEYCRVPIHSVAGRDSAAWVKAT